MNPTSTIFSGSWRWLDFVPAIAMAASRSVAACCGWNRRACDQCTIWRSPLWMPLAWEIVAVQFGYIGLRLWERFGTTGLLMIGFLGAMNIPFYEEMARRIHWWQYNGCRMISFTPWYIILGEFGIAVVFALLARLLRRDRWHLAIVAGIVGGASIFVCYAAAFLITDRLIS